MSVEQHEVVDFVAVDPTTQNPTLVISDRLPWHDVNEHLYGLQEKLNAYLRFIESGELANKFPDTIGKPITIEIVLKYPFPETAIWFFERASAAITAAGLTLQWRVTP